MQKLRIKNWHKYQQYKDRNPTWFKVHKSMLTSRDWVLLDNDGRALMIALMMMACTFDDSLIPHDEDYICRVAYFKKVNIKPLIDIGFLEVVLDDTEKYGNVSNGTLYDSVSAYDSLSESKIEIVNENVSRETFTDEFLEFWERYPKTRAGSKQKSWSAWQYAIKRSKALPSEIIAGCLAYAASEEVDQGYAKGCAAWLNDDRWLSDYSSKPKKTNQKEDYFDGIMKSTVRGVAS